MKNFLFPALVLLALSPVLVHAQAQAPAGAVAVAPATAAQPAPIDVLTLGEKTHLDAAHQNALTATPKLKQDEEKLRTDLEALRATQATPAQKEQFMASFRAYRKELEVAMLKVDPTVQPIIDKLHAEEARLKAAAPAQHAPPQ